MKQVLASQVPFAEKLAKAMAQASGSRENRTLEGGFVAGPGLWPYFEKDGTERVSGTVRLAVVSRGQVKAAATEILTVPCLELVSGS